VQKIKPNNYVFNKNLTQNPSQIKHNNSQITAAYTTPTTTSYSTSSTNVVTSLSTNMPKSSSQGNLSTVSQTPITVPSQSSQLQQQQEPIEAPKEQLVLSVSTMSTATAAPSPNTLAVNGGPTSTTTTAPKLSPNQTVAGAISVAASPSLPLITHTASASNLVEFFCNVSESKMVAFYPCFIRINLNYYMNRCYSRVMI
jgi:hypothetical protein